MALETMLSMQGTLPSGSVRPQPVQARRAGHCSKVCRSMIQREDCRKHREKRLEAARRWREAHPDYFRMWYRKNAGCFRVRKNGGESDAGHPARGESVPEAAPLLHAGGRPRRYTMAGISSSAEPVGILIAECFEPFRLASLQRRGGPSPPDCLTKRRPPAVSWRAG